MPIWNYGGAIPKNILKTHFFLPRLFAGVELLCLTLFLIILTEAFTRAYVLIVIHIN
jgi:hypothetical protein